MNYLEFIKSLFYKKEQYKCCSNCKKTSSSKEAAEIALDNLIKSVCTNKLNKKK